MKPSHLILSACAIFALATAPAAFAKVVTLTFTGVAGDGGYGPPWGYDAYGNHIVGDPYTAKLQFDLSQGTLTDFGTEQEFVAGGGYSGTFTIAGHTYDATGSTTATYLRTDQSIEMIIYDDPKANTGLVLYAPLTNTAHIGVSVGKAVQLLTLNPADVALSGADVVLPKDSGALYAFENVQTLQVTVPEPSTWALMMIGLGGIGIALRRRTAIA